MIARQNAFDDMDAQFLTGLDDDFTVPHVRPRPSGRGGKCVFLDQQSKTYTFYAWRTAAFNSDSILTMLRRLHWSRHAVLFDLFGTLRSNSDGTTRDGIGQEQGCLCPFLHNVGS